jgi:hypothetical protein
MRRARFEVVYIKDPDQIKQINETKLAREKYHDFLKKTQEVNSNLENQDSNINSIDLENQIKNIPKPKFKGDNKTFPFFKEKKKESKSIRQSIFQSLGFSSNKEEKNVSNEKEYPILFNSKATIKEGFSKSSLKEIETPQIPMKLDHFLGQFTNEKDMGSLELNQILDIDYAKLEILKKKALEFIDATSHVLENEKDNDSSVEELVIFFNEKLQQIRANDINIQIFIQNLERVNGICYEPNGAKIVFKREKKFD